MTNQTFQIGDRVRVLRDGTNDVNDESEIDNHDTPLSLFLHEQGFEFEPGLEAVITDITEYPDYGTLLVVEFADFYDECPEQHHLSKYVRANQIEVVGSTTAVAPTPEAAAVVEDFAEWEKELLGVGTDKRPDLNAGDIVRITGFTPDFAANETHEVLSQFIGLEVEVLDPQEPVFGTQWVRPLTERPDGFGMDEFGTLGFTVELVSAAAATEASPADALAVGDKAQVVSSAWQGGEGFHVFMVGTVVTVVADDGEYLTVVGPRPADGREIPQMVKREHVAPLSLTSESLVGAHILDDAGIEAAPEGTEIQVEGYETTATKVDGQFVRRNVITGTVYNLRDVSDPSVEPWRVIFDPTTV